MTLRIDVLVRYGSITLGIIFFLIPMYINRKTKKKNILADLIIIGLSGSLVPTGLALIYCAFDPSNLVKLSDAGIYIAFSGLALLYIAFTTIKSKL